jgi:hypothetical protein
MCVNQREERRKSIVAKTKKTNSSKTHREFEDQYPIILGTIALSFHFVLYCAFPPFSY